MINSNRARSTRVACLGLGAFLAACGAPAQALPKGVVSPTTSTSELSVTGNDKGNAATDEQLLTDEDMGVEDHMVTARNARAMAALHRAWFNPRAIAWRPVADRGQEFPLWDDPYFIHYEMVSVQIFNPTEIHEREADAYSQHARKHETAAFNICSREVRQCLALESSARSGTAPGAKIERIVQVSGGALLYLSEDENPGEVAFLVQCRLARKAVEAWRGVTRCPLHRKNLTVNAVPGTNVIHISSDEPDDDAFIEEIIRKLPTRSSLEMSSDLIGKSE